MPRPVDFDPFADEDERQLKTPRDLGIDVLDASAFLRNNQLDLSGGPQEYDAFSVFGDTRRSPMAEAFAKPATPAGPGVFGTSFGMLSPEESQADLRSRREAYTQAQATISQLERLRDLPINRNRQAALQSQIDARKAALPDLGQIERMEQGQAPLATKTALRSGIENAATGVINTALTVPEYVGILKGYLTHGIGGRAQPSAAGMRTPGNIDLNTRPKVRNPDGSISTVRSMSVNFGDGEVLIPTVSDDGRLLSDDEAVEQYRRTGKHLGIFDTPDNATAYAESLHAAQERQYVRGEKPQQGTVDDDALLQWSLRAKDWVQQQFPGDQARQADFSQQFASGLGQVATFYGSGALAALLKAGPKAAAAVVAMLGSSAVGSQGFEEGTRELAAAKRKAEAEGRAADVTEYDRLLKTLGYTALGATEAIPIARTFSRIAPDPTTQMGARLVGGAESALEEAAQESGSQLGQNIVTQNTTDPSRQTTEGVSDSAAVGGALGGLMGFLFPGFGGVKAGRAPAAPGTSVAPAPAGPSGGFPGQPMEEFRGELRTVPEEATTSTGDIGTWGQPLALPAPTTTTGEDTDTGGGPTADGGSATQIQALRGEIERQVRANPGLAPMMADIMTRFDDNPQLVGQAAVQLAETGKLSRVANDLMLGLQTMPSGLERQQFGATTNAMTLPVGTAAPVPTGRPTASGTAPEMVPEVADLPFFALSGEAQPGPDLDEQGYYSKALETAKAIPQPRGSGQQFLGMLRNAGVKQSEIDATGVGKWLASKPQVSRDELVQFLTDRRVKLDVSRRAAVPTKEELARRQFSRPYASLNDDDQELVDHMWRERHYNAGQQPKFARYSLDPSNPTYSEDVLHLPAFNRDDVVPTPASAAKYQAEWDAINEEIRAFDEKWWGGPGGVTRKFPDNQVGQKIRERDALKDRREAIHQKMVDDTIANMPDAAKVHWTSGHWPEPNIIAHLRTQQLQTTDGRTSLNLDELQSDEGQKIREGGVADKEKARRLWAEAGPFAKERDDLNSSIDSLVMNILQDTSMFAPDQQVRLEALRSDASPGRQYMRRLSRGRMDDMDGAPAPARGYVATQIGQIIGGETGQRLIDMANRAAHATGEFERLNAEALQASQGAVGHPLVNTTDQWVETALRHLITKAVRDGVDGISVTPSRVVSQRFHPANHGVVALRYSPDQGILQSKQTGGSWNDHGTVAADQLHTYVGREMADKLIQAPMEEAWGEQWHVLDNLGGIELNDEGMRATYDQMYPRALGKILRGYDKSIKPEKVRLWAGNENAGDRAAHDDRYADTPSAFNNDFTFFPLTDLAKAKIEEKGFPLFALGGVLDDGEIATAITAGAQVAANWEAALTQRGAALGAATQALATMVQGDGQTPDDLRNAMTSAGIVDIQEGMLDEGMLAAELLKAGQDKAPLFALQGFYDPVARAVDMDPTKQTSPQGWWNRITKAPNVRHELLRYMGLKQWLDEQPQNKPLSREDVLNFILSHQIDLTEHLREAETALWNRQDVNDKAQEIYDKQVDEWVDRNMDDYRPSVNYEVYETEERGEPTGRWTYSLQIFSEANGNHGDPIVSDDEFDTQEEAEAAAEKHRDWEAEVRRNATSDSNISWDSAMEQAMEELNLKTGWSEYSIGEGDDYKELLIRWPRMKDEWQSPHMEDHEIAHVRFDDRDSTYVSNDTDRGSRGYNDTVMFIQEIQSDLHQRASTAERKGAGGYKPANAAERLTEVWNSDAAFDYRGAKEAMRRLDLERLMLRERSPELREPGDLEAVQERFMDAADRADAALQELKPLTEQLAKDLNVKPQDVLTWVSNIYPESAHKQMEQALFPDAPYKGKEWWQLAFKAALQRAVQKDYDAIALPTPDQVSETVGLSLDVAKKFYGEELPNWIKKYVKQWGGKLEKRRISGTPEQSVMTIRPDVTAENAIRHFELAREKLEGEHAWKVKYDRERGLPPVDMDEHTKLTIQRYGNLIGALQNMKELGRATPERIQNSIFAEGLQATANRSFLRDSEEGPSGWGAMSAPGYVNESYGGRHSWTSEQIARATDYSPGLMTSEFESPEQVYLRLTPAMKQDLRKSGQSLAAGPSEGAVQATIRAQLAMNKPVHFNPDMAEKVFVAIDSVKQAIPAGHDIGALKRAHPWPKDPTRVVAVFELEDGSERMILLPLNEFLGTRAFFTRAQGDVRPGVFLARKNLPNQFLDSLRGELRHEAVHALREGGFIPAGDWQRLLDHAVNLRVLNMSVDDYLEIIGYPRKGGEYATMALGRLYHKLYGSRADYAEAMQQEAVAHMVELYSHGEIKQENLDPVLDLLTKIIDGTYAGNPKDDLKSYPGERRFAKRNPRGPELAPRAMGAVAEVLSDRDRRILRQESATLRSDGSIVSGRITGAPRRGVLGWRDAGAIQRAGTTVQFDIPGHKGEVTATPSRYLDKFLAQLDYEVFPEDGGNGLWSGRASIAQHPDGTWEVQDLEVDESARRQGIASKLYQAIERDLGIRMSPSGLLMPDGYAFWKRRSPESVKWHRDFDGMYISPRRAMELLQFSGQTMASLQRFVDAGQDWAKTDLEAEKQRRGRLVKLIHQLPAEAKAARETMFAVGDNSKQTKTPAFEKWFGDSRVVDENGDPKIVYHGTHGDFTRFDPQMANIESDMGAGFYFTSEPRDIQHNYSRFGADVENRVQRIVEQFTGDEDFYAEIEEANEGKDPDDPDYIDVDTRAREAAREQLGHANEGLSLPVYLKIEKPVVIGNPYGKDRGETFFDVDMPYDEETDEYGEETGKLVEFAQALRQVLERYDAYDREIDQIIGDVFEAARDADGLTASGLITILKHNNSLMEMQDSVRGDYAGSEIIRETFEEMGFDGIIDHTVYSKWGKGARRFGGGMEGMNSDTVHYIVFKPTQIKSAIGNRGSFDPENPDITWAFAGEKAATADLTARDKAMAMQELGQSPQDILRETGWHLGPDGRWRFEIDDSQMTIKLSPEQLRDRAASRPRLMLPDLIDHPQLFQAYPQLAKIRVELLNDATLGFAGGFTPAMAIGEGSSRPTLQFNIGDLSFTPAGGGMHTHKGTLIHELQHAIQFIEDFATGGNYEIAYFRFIDRLLAGTLTPADRDLVKKRGARPLLTVLENNKPNVAWIKAMRTPGGEPPTLTPEQEAKKLNLREAFYGLAQMISRDLYNRLAGESEARLVDERRDMPPQLRQQTYPEPDVADQEMDFIHPSQAYGHLKAGVYSVSPIRPGVAVPQAGNQAPVKDYIAHTLEATDAKATSEEALYQDYHGYARSQGLTPMPPQTFIQALRDQGLHPIKIAGQRRYLVAIRGGEEDEAGSKIGQLLRRAKQLMGKGGVPKATVTEQTGWYLDEDGRWQFRMTEAAKTMIEGKPKKPDKK